jgi:hypothetical protein
METLQTSTPINSLPKSLYIYQKGALSACTGGEIQKQFQQLVLWSNLTEASL